MISRKDADDGREKNAAELYRPGAVARAPVRAAAGRDAALRLLHAARRRVRAGLSASDPLRRAGLCRDRGGGRARLSHHHRRQRRDLPERGRKALLRRGGYRPLFPHRLRERRDLRADDPAAGAVERTGLLCQPVQAHGQAHAHPRGGQGRFSERLLDG